jgi:CheY-like chemotaxis protein
VSFLSEPGTGTTFTFRLPARDRHGEVPDRQVPRGLHVLVVDDMRVNRMILRHQLETQGCRVEEAHDGHAALEAICASPFDLVLLDLQMPGMSGIDLARAIRAREQDTDLHLRLVALTGYDDRENHGACRAAGIDEILEKPVDGATLKDVLARRAARD